jgi:hypothetical protein
MPKIRDLGINVIPATMQPPQIGEGGGGKGGGGGGDCEGATHEVPQGAYEELPCTPGTAACTPGTAKADDYAQVHGYAQCTPGTVNNNSANCYARGYGHMEPPCWLLSLITCTPGTVDYEGCTPGTRATTPHIVHLTAAQTNRAAGSGLAREAIELLKKQLQEAIAQLDEIAKNIEDGK